MGVIFDMNGVLVLDEQLHEVAFRDVLEPWGIAVSHSDFRELYLGRPDMEGATLAGARSGVQLPVEEVVRAKRERYWQLVRASGALGIEESAALVRALRAAQLRLALATASPADEASAWLDALGLSGVFDPVLHRDNSPEPKPSPSVYTAILRRWRAAHADCVVLDDHPENIAIARALGLRTVAVTTSFAPERFGPADVVVHSLAVLHSAAP